VPALLQVRCGASEARRSVRLVAQRALATASGEALALRFLAPAHEPAAEFSSAAAFA
jgi:hypothetical protein